MTREDRAPGDIGAGIARRQEERVRASEHWERRGGRLGGQVSQGLDTEDIAVERRPALLTSDHRGSLEARGPPLWRRVALASGLGALICAHVGVSVETGLKILGCDRSSHVHLVKVC